MTPDFEWCRLVKLLAKRYPGSFKWGVVLKRGKNDAFLSEQVKEGTEYIWES